MPRCGEPKSREARCQNEGDASEAEATLRENHHFSHLLHASRGRLGRRRLLRLDELGEPDCQTGRNRQEAAEPANSACSAHRFVTLVALQAHSIAHHCAASAPLIPPSSPPPPPPHPLANELNMILFSSRHANFNGSERACSETSRPTT